MTISIKNRAFIVVLLGILIASAGCSAKIQPIRSSEAVVGYNSQVSGLLHSLPAPEAKIVVGVYKFRDQTGQYKPGGAITQYSTAVTQGATSMLVKALADAGNGRWFTVLERESLPNLLNERKIIRQTRKQYLNKDSAKNVPRLPPLLYAPIMMDGGVIAYESNLLTGGAGARYFGAGGNTQFQRDSVTIYLRAISVKNGQIVKSVLTNKTIFSLEVDAGLFRFVSFKRLLEIETGFTTNEPPQMAVLEAIEKAVYAMVIEGVMEGLWNFQDSQAGKQFIEEYLKEKDPNLVAKFDEKGNYMGENYVRPVSVNKPLKNGQNVGNKKVMKAAPPAPPAPAASPLADSSEMVKDSGAPPSNGKPISRGKPISPPRAIEDSIQIEPRPQDYRRQGFN